MKLLGGNPVTRRSVLKFGAIAAAMPLMAYNRNAFAASDQKLTIMLLGPSADVVKEFNETLLPSFTAKTGIAVELQQSTWGSGFQKVTTAAASGTLADITMLGGIWTAPLASKNVLLPLDTYLAKWADKDNFYPSMIADGAYKGVNYALPLYADTRTALYRGDLLAAAGITANDIPTDWDGYTAMAKAVATAGGSAAKTPVYWNQDQSIGLQQSFAMLMLQAGGTYWAEDGSAMFASDQGIAALEYLTSFFKDGLSDVNQVFSGAGPRPLVGGTSIANFGAGFSTITNARANAPGIDKKIIAGLPLASTKGGKPITSAWINKLAISAKTKNPDGAWALLEHLVSHDAAESLAYLFGGLPARKDLANAKYLEGVSPGLAAASQYVVPQPSHPNMLIIAKEIETAVEKAVRQVADPKTALTELNSKLNEINGV